MNSTIQICIKCHHEGNVSTECSWFACAACGRIQRSYHFGSSVDRLPLSGEEIRAHAAEHLWSHVSDPLHIDIMPDVEAYRMLRA